jgi:putative transposase
VVTPEAKRTVVGFWRSQHRISERRACRLIALCRATQRYVRRPERRPELRARLRELAAQRRRFGYRRLHTMLEREGIVVNIKRVRRLYREEGLSLRQRRGRRRYRGVRVIAALPTCINQRWSMDFMSDALGDGRTSRTSRSSMIVRGTRPGSWPTSPSGPSASRFLDALSELPSDVVCDNGPEFTSQHFDRWAHERRIRCTSFARGNPSITATSRASTAGFAMSA